MIRIEHETDCTYGPNHIGGHQFKTNRFVIGFDKCAVRILPYNNANHETYTEIHEILFGDHKKEALLHKDSKWITPKAIANAILKGETIIFNGEEL